MVGMVISMIVILAMLTVYKTTLQKTGEAGRGASTDGQRLAALFTSQTLLQGAGFGIASAVFGTDLVVLSGANLGAPGTQITGSLVGALPATGNAIIWGALIPPTPTSTPTYVCSGLYAPASGGLIRLPTVRCTGASASWNSIAWDQNILVRDDTSDSDRTFKIDVTQATACKTFGIGGSGGLLVRLSTQNSFSSTPATGTTCLTNF
jgi:hypothetical protein